MQFQNISQKLPVVWHQSLLVFAQRYKNSLREGQRKVLRAVLKKHQHHLITSEIRRELNTDTSAMEAV